MASFVMRLFSSKWPLLLVLAACDSGNEPVSIHWGAALAPCTETVFEDAPYSVQRWTAGESSEALGARAATPAAAPDSISLRPRCAFPSAEAQQDACLSLTPAPLGLIYLERAQAIADEGADMLTEHALSGLGEDLVRPLLHGGLKARCDGRTFRRERSATAGETLS